MAAVRMPTGSAWGSSVRVTRSAPTTRTAPSRPEASSGGREPPVEADGDLRRRRARRTRSARRRRRPWPRAATAIRTTAACAERQPHAEPAGGVVAELQRRPAPGRRPARAARARASDSASGTAWSQLRRVERAGDPHVGRGGVVDLGVGEQPVGERGHRRPERDADEHQPVAVDPGPPGEHEQQGAGERAPPASAREGRRRRRPRRSARSRRPRPTEAPCVMPRTSGQASGLRAKVWKIAPAMPSASPTSRPTTIRGSAQLQDDELLRLLAEPGQGAQHVADGRSGSRRGRG